MTEWKSNGVDTTSSRSGQVKPSNSMPSARRTLLLAPSAPISQRPVWLCVAPLRSIATVTDDPSCVTSCTRLLNAISKPGLPRNWSSRMRVSLDCSACTR